MPNDPIKVIITKYSSRRLYNTSTSEYVTLEQIAQIIRDGREIQIIDKETNEDVTNQYLLQIISEYEGNNGNTLPKNILTEIIKNYNTTTQNIMPEILAKTFDFWKKNQNEFFKNFNSNKNFDNDNMKMINEWQNLQSDVFKNMVDPWLKNSNKKHENPKNQDNSSQNYSEKKSDIDIMKEQIAELQERLNKK